MKMVNHPVLKRRMCRAQGLNHQINKNSQIKGTYGAYAHIMKGVRA